MTYMYTCGVCGTTHTKFTSIAGAKRKIRCGSEKCRGFAFRDIVAEQRGARVEQQSNTTWPMKSDALGVHPSQVKGLQEKLAKRGCPTEFTRDGRAVLTGPAHRKAVCQVRGFFDRNGGYGDPQQRNNRG